jgi:hypothetical protein
MTSVLYCHVTVSNLSVSLFLDLYVVVGVENMKSLGKRSFLRSVLRALGIDKSFVSHLPSQAETQSGISVSYQSYSFARTALLEAECAKAKGFIEIRHRTIR